MDLEEDTEVEEMTIACSVCGKEFRSLLIDADKAIAEVSEQFVQHLAKQHPIPLAAVSRDLNALLRLLTWFLSMQLVKVATDEEQFHAQYVKQGEGILRLIGLSNEQISAIGLEHRLRKPDDVAGKQTAGPIVV